jgi:DNA-3-methyladenine glycosylase I
MIAFGCAPGRTSDATFVWHKSSNRSAGDKPALKTAGTFTSSTVSDHISLPRGLLVGETFTRLTSFSPMSGIVIGEDGVRRCAWGASTPEYQTYHDEEWGRPVGDDSRVYEKLCLEGFQAGLSWLTILRKRDGFRRAFASFDPIVVAAFGDADVDRLLADAGIVRHRAKILATINNAQATARLRDQGVSLAALVWKHEPSASRPPRNMGDVPSSTPESKSLSAELRSQGFNFVGPTTVYAAMQSLGVVNDHLDGCQFRAVAQAERAQFRVPI